MNFAMVAVALVLGADGVKECVDVQSTPDTRVQQCGNYVFSRADVLPLTTRPTIDHFFAAVLTSVSSPPVEPKHIDVSIGKTKYDGRVAVVPSGSFAGAEVLAISMPLPNTERVRLLACVAQLNLGAKRDECVKHFSVMRNEPVMPERENVVPSLGGVSIAVPDGCSVVEGGIRCDDGLLILPPGELSGRSGDDVDRAVASIITLLAKISESASPVSSVDCVAQGKPTRCQLISSSDKMKQRYFHLASAVTDGDKTRAAVCLSSTDPRTKLPAVCRSLFAFEPEATPPPQAAAGCQPLPDSPDSRGEACPGYVFSFTDAKKSSDSQRSKLHFMGMVTGRHSQVEPREVEVTIGDENYTALVGVMPTGTMAGWELILVTTPLPDPERARTLSCFAQLPAGSTRERCLKKFKEMRDEPPLKEPEALPLSLEGKRLDVPEGCVGKGGAIICRGSALAMPEVDLAKLTGEERERVLGELMKHTVAQKVVELNTPVDCVVQGKPARCLLSRSQKGSQEIFTLGAIVADGNKRRVASCTSDTDPRKALPPICSIVFSFKGSK